MNGTSELHNFTSYLWKFLVTYNLNTEFSELIDLDFNEIRELFNKNFNNLVARIHLLIL